MKKYRLLKDLPYFNKWDIIRVENNEVYNDSNWEISILNWLVINEYFHTLIWEWFEEIIEKKTFKILDKVIIDNDDNKMIWIITMYDDFLDEYLVWESRLKSDIIRLATEEEIQKYF